MIDMTAKLALRQVTRILDQKADDVTDMITEGMFDTQSTMTAEHAASYLAEILTELSLEIGQVAAELLKEVTPPAETVEHIV